MPESDAVPARPTTRAVAPRTPPGDGPATADNPAYVAWLESSSMLRAAVDSSRQLAGTGALWQHSYALPDPRAAVRRASVWFTTYPAALLTRPGTSFLATVGDPALWDAFAEIGIEALHTGPVKEAGAVVGWEQTPTIDGHFDRISTRVDPAFGTDADYRALCEVASSRGGTVIDDVVPAHTGKGADFRLAEMAVGDYPGIYHLVLVEPEDWHLLPDVADGRDSVNLDVATEQALADAGYIVGALQRVLFQAPGVKETNWSATAPVRGVDGVERRWVYLHYFKEGQPSINWLDPSFAGPRLVIGDAVQSLTDFGSGGLRLDANGFLGVERRPDGPAWSEGHPLAEAGNHLLASMIRKLGAFSFQELNLSLDAIAAMSRTGADLSYDFVTRPAYHHALLTGDASFLRLVLREALALGIDTGSLVHALQNHDELTYELVHFTDIHRDDVYDYRGEQVRGGDLADSVRADLRAALTGDAHPYNLTFTTNGIACTTASLCAAALGVRDLEVLTDDDLAAIRRLHLLLAAFNALQPGVVALSGWDLTGCLTLPPSDVAHLMGDADTRWINRGAHDVLGVAGDATSSASGLPRARALYGSVPDQLADPASFASGLRDLLRVRAEHRVAEATLVAVPDVRAAGGDDDVRAVLELELALHDGRAAFTVLNLGSAPVTVQIDAGARPPGSAVLDLTDGRETDRLDERGGFRLEVLGHTWRLVAIGG